MLKSVLVWPKGLRDEDLLDLAVRNRRRGEKIAVWLQETEKLVVLFDGKQGCTWSQYDADHSWSVAPWAHFVIDHSIRSETKAEIAGIVIEKPNYILSYSYQSKWQSGYLRQARLFNREKQPIALDVFWEYYVLMSFGSIDESEYVTQIRQLFEGYGQEIVKRGLSGMETHIPLLLDADELFSIQ